MNSRSFYFGIFIGPLCLLFIFFLVRALGCGYCQGSKNTPHPFSNDSIIINQIHANNRRVVLYYSLLNDQPGVEFLIQLYNSRNDSALEVVEGDIGKVITDRKGKQVVWWARKEFANTFDGNIELELKGSINHSFIKLPDSASLKVIYLNKPLEIYWTGGEADDLINIDLISARSRYKYRLLNNQRNTGYARIEISDSTKPGNYYLKVTNSKDIRHLVVTPEFKVKRKFPLGLSIGVRLVVGATFLAYPVWIIATNLGKTTL